MSERKMLLISDGDFVSTGVEKELETQGYRVTTVNSGRKALKLIKNETFDLVIIDSIKDGINSFKAAKDIKEVCPETITMIITANRDAEFVIEAFRLGVDDCLLKPFEKEDLFLRIKSCLEKREFKKKNREPDGKIAINERFRIMFEYAPDAYYINDKKGVFLDGNKAAEDMVGYKKEELIGKNFLKLNLLPFKQIPKAAALLFKSALRKATGPDEFTIIRKDGSQVFVEIRTYPIVLEDRVMVLGIAHDITQRKKTEEELKRISNEQKIILDSCPAGILYKDIMNNYIWVNKAASECIGMKKEDIEGKSAYDIIPEHAEQFYRSDLEVINSGMPRLGVIEQWQNIAGEERWTRADKIPFRNEDGEVIGIINFDVDITEQKRMEEAIRESEAKLAQSQKIEAVGRLAGGIAHDFNNLLTTILGYSDIILLQQNLDDELIESVKEIKASSIRAATLTKQLLAFSRKQVLRPKAISLNDLITNLSKMLGRLIGEDIELIIKPDTDRCRIKADPGQIEQIIMNLVVNARDAMPKGGKLAIETQSIYLDESYNREYPDVTPGYYVLLAVSDTGRGMDEETRKQIFDPFFTTKEVGKGTGLGLSTVYGIVKQSGGYVWVYSEPDHGTTLKIYLPKTIEETEKQQESPADKQEPMSGIETILLVEDEKSLRKLALKVLKKLGYSVIEATDGMGALEIVNREDHPAIDLLVTDVIMPKMGGKELSEKLILRYPKIKVLYISGYTDNAIVHHGVLDEGVSLLQKPFSSQTLAQKVREVLGKRQG